MRDPSKTVYMKHRKVRLHKFYNSPRNLVEACIKNWAQQESWPIVELVEGKRKSFGSS